MAQMKHTFRPGMMIPIGSFQWRILDVDSEADTALLIADNTEYAGPYHEKWGEVTWKTCTLRKWLNSEFYKNEFSEEEKKAIIETNLENPNNPEYGTPGGNTTKDRVFLLSIDEADRFFKNNNDRAIGASWWLRSPGCPSYYAAYVSEDGSVQTFGNDPQFIYAVRPALKIDLKSELFQSIIRD